MSTIPIRIQNKHLHIHENNLHTDKHWKPFSKQAEKKVITKKLFTTLTTNRTYIYEIPAKISKKNNKG